jgi:hypothetical protein
LLLEIKYESARPKGWRQNIIDIFGEDSKAVQFLDGKIAASPYGENDEVVAAESQMIHLLATIELVK